MPNRTGFTNLFSDSAAAMKGDSSDTQLATLTTEKRVIQEVAKTMPFLPRRCRRGSEELAVMTCRLHLDPKP